MKRMKMMLMTSHITTTIITIIITIIIAVIRSSSSSSLPSSLSSTQPKLSQLLPPPQTSGAKTPVEQSANFIHLEAPLKNLTKFEGDRVKLECEIMGLPTPLFAWYKNDKLLGMNQQSKYEIKSTPSGNTLKIKKLQLDDEGMYKCVATNTAGTNTTQAHLTVRAAKNASPKKIPNKDGYNDEDDDYVDDYNDDDDDDDDDDVYDDDDVRPKYTKGRKSGNVTGKKKNYLDSDQSGSCEQYRGSICSKYIDYSLIFVFDIHHQNMLEEWTTDIMNRMNLTGDISPQCKQHLITNICLLTFSTCSHKDVKKISQTKNVCKEDCESVKTIHCASEYKVLRDGIGAGSSNLFEHNRLENLRKVLDAVNCSALKSYTQNPGDCYNVDLLLTTYLTGDKCYSDNGQTYRGLVSTSISNKPCLRWANVGKFYEVNGVGTLPAMMTHNFCRNNDQSMSSPWCYVDIEGVPKKEMCSVPNCDLSDDDQQQKGILIGVSCAFLIIIIILIVVCAKVRRHKLENKKKKSSDDESQGLQNKTNSNLHMKAMPDRQSMQTSSTTSSVPNYIPPSNVSLSFEMCDGVYGKIYKGEILSLLSPNQERKSVNAVFKTLDPTSEAQTMTEFWANIDVVGELHHPNVTAVLGLNKTSHPFFVAFEASAYGDLNEYLKSNSRVLETNTALDQKCLSRVSILPHTVLISLAVQVANALEYLHSKKFIHSELNSHNVFVCENGLVKVSLATPGQGLHYYKLANSVKPILLRWSSPEVVTSSQYFSEKNDVWMFGVLLWEIYSTAEIPYRNFTDMEVMEIIKSYRILTNPAQCPANVYSLMVRCWHKTPASRPPASEVHEELRQAWSEYNKSPSINNSSGSDRSHLNLNNNNNSNGGNNSCNNTLYEIGCRPMVQPMPHVQPAFCNNLNGNNINTYNVVGVNTSNSSQPTTISNKRLASNSSSASQKSSPSSSSCNFKSKNNNLMNANNFNHQVVPDAGLSVREYQNHYLMGEMYNEQIV